MPQKSIEINKNWHILLKQSHIHNTYNKNKNKNTVQSTGVFIFSFSPL